MADERVNITIDIDVKDLKQVLLTSGALKGLNIAAGKTEQRLNKLSGAMAGSNLQMLKGKNGTMQFTRQLGLLERVGAKVVKRARSIMFATIAMVAEFGVSALTLASVNGLFVIGQAVMKAYNVGMQALAGTVAAFGVAAIAAAAAFKEFQAAQYQYRYKDSKEVGTALDQSGYALRSLYKDSTLASFGVQGLSAAFAGVNKNSAFTPATKAALKALADFAQASGNPQESLAAAANFVGLMQKNKKFTSETLAAAKQISPEFEKAFKKGGYKDVQKFMDDLTSGKLATSAGVAGQADAVNKTLFAQFKSYLSAGLVELSDVGTRVLEPVKEAMFNIFNGLMRTFRRVSGDLVGFGKGPFLQSLVDFTYRIEEFTVTLFRKFLPATEGFWKRVSRVFEGLKVYFYEVRDALDRLREGGSIVIKTFGKPLLEIFKQIGKSAAAIGELAKKNRANWEKFSDAITRFVQGFFDMSKGFRTAFDAALPIISLLIKFVGQLMSLIGSMMKMAGNLPGVLGTAGGALATMGFGYAAFKGRRAARFQNNRNAAAAASGTVPMSLEEATYSGMRFQNMTGPEQPGLSPLSGAMGASGAMSGENITAVQQLEEQVKHIDTIAKLKGKAESKGGKALGAIKAATVNVYGDVVNVSNRRGGRGGRGRGSQDLKTLERRGLSALTPFASESTGQKNIYGRPIGPNSSREQLLKLRTMGKDEYKRFESMRRMQANYPNAGPSSSMLGGKNFRYATDRRMQQQGILGGMSYTSMGSRLRGIPGGIRDRYNSYGGAGGALRYAWDGTSSSSLGGGSGGLSGQMGGGSKFTGGGVRGMAGRFFMGQSYKPGEKMGFSKRTAQMLGMEEGGRSGGRFGEGYRAARANALESGQKFSRGKGMRAGLKNSLSGGGMVASLAASAGISALQNKGIVSEEAGGGMQLGASLAAINPMLGLAVGAGLTALSSKTKMGGMVSGAVSGAAIGGMIAGPAGAFFGTFIGAGLGVLAAKRNQKKMAKEGVKNIGNQFMSQVASSALAGVNTGSTTGARMQVERFGALSKSFSATTSKAQREEVLKPYEDILGKNQFDLMTGDNAGDAATQFKKTANNMKAALTPAFNQFDDVMRSLMLSTGKTGDEIMALAMEKNVNLYDSTLKLSDITAKLGEGMTKTAKQFSDSLRDVQIASMGVFEQFKKSKDMKDALQAAGETIRGGDASTEAVADYLQKQADLLNYKNPDSPLSNIVFQLQDFGTGLNAGKGRIFQAGGPLAGTTLDAETTQLIGSMGDQQMKGVAQTAASQLGSMMTGAGFQFGNADLGRKNLEIQIETLMRKAAGGDETAIGQVKKLEEDLLRGTALQGKTGDQIAQYLSSTLGGSLKLGTEGQKGTTTFMGQSVIGEVSGSYEQFGKALNEEATALRQGFLDAIESGFFAAKGTPDWWNTTPSWWQAGLKVDKDGNLVPAEDTSTPRAGRVGDTSVSKTLSRTMSRHNQFDSMLTGKRTVTSSWRDYNLGSPSSDHVTGKAYDLTGQNLGQYATMINAAGGFAEFHGAAGSRHLHVVPPAGPTGDTSTAKVAMAANGNAPQVSAGDNITVNVYETKDPRATAQEVAKQLLSMQRNWKQRS